MPKITDDIKTAVMLLRYHTTAPIEEYPAYCSFTKIAKFLERTRN